MFGKSQLSPKVPPFDYLECRKFYENQMKEIRSQVPELNRLYEGSWVMRNILIPVWREVLWFGNVDKQKIIDEAREKLIVLP